VTAAPAASAADAAGATANQKRKPSIRKNDEKLDSLYKVLEAERNAASPEMPDEACERLGWKAVTFLAKAWMQKWRMGSGTRDDFAAKKKLLRKVELSNVKRFNNELLNHVIAGSSEKTYASLYEALGKYLTGRGKDKDKIGPSDFDVSEEQYNFAKNIIEEMLRVTAKSAPKLTQKQVEVIAWTRAWMEWKGMEPNKSRWLIAEGSGLDTRDITAMLGESPHTVSESVYEGVYLFMRSQMRRYRGQCFASLPADYPLPDKANFSAAGTGVLESTSTDAAPPPGEAGGAEVSESPKPKRNRPKPPMPQEPVLKMPPIEPVGAAPHLPDYSKPITLAYSTGAIQAPQFVSSGSSAIVTENGVPRATIGTQVEPPLVSPHGPSSPAPTTPANKNIEDIWEKKVFLKSGFMLSPYKASELSGLEILLQNHTRPMGKKVAVYKGASPTDDAPIAVQIEPEVRVVVAKVTCLKSYFNEDAWNEIDAGLDDYQKRMNKANVAVGR